MDYQGVVDHQGGSLRRGDGKGEVTAESSYQKACTEETLAVSLRNTCAELKRQVALYGWRP